MQYLYLGKKFYFGSASLLFFKDDFNKYNAVTKVLTRGVWSRYTNGAYINAVILKKLSGKTGKPKPPRDSFRSPYKGWVAGFLWVWRIGQCIAYHLSNRVGRNALAPAVV